MMVSSDSKWPLNGSQEPHLLTLAAWLSGCASIHRTRQSLSLHGHIRCAIMQKHIAGTFATASPRDACIHQQHAAQLHVCMSLQEAVRLKPGQQQLGIDSLLHAMCQVWVQGVLQPQAEAGGAEQQGCGGHPAAGGYHSGHQPRGCRHQVSHLHFSFQQHQCPSCDVECR